MIKQYLKFEALIIDNDEVKFKISCSNEFASSSLEVFGYLDEFKKFGRELINFPKNSNDVKKYELGGDTEEWAYYLLIKVFCFEPSGQTAIQFKISNKQKVPNLIESNFYLQTYPSSINKLGKRLFNWEPEKTPKLKYIIEKNG